MNIRIGDKTYPVKLECEENKKVPQGRYAKRSKQSHQNISNLTQKNNNVKIVHLYNIKEIKNPKTYYQDAENNENKILFNVLNADVYDVIIDKKMIVRSTSFNNKRNMGEPSIDSIDDNMQNFNPDELTVEEMLKGVKAREELKKRGYDGVNNDKEEYIAFRPKQIKSVENQGSFDSNNPNIY